MQIVTAPDRTEALRAAEKAVKEAAAELGMPAEFAEFQLSVILRIVRDIDASGHPKGGNA